MAYPLSPKLTYIGHATNLIEMDGVRILTDPVLRQRVMHLRHRQVPLIAADYEHLDAVLVSHLHFDHLDLPSLRLLGQSTRLIVPHGAGNLLRNFHAVEEIRAGETTQVGSITIEATYADHDAERHRLPFGPSAESLGFILHGSCTIYFAGDTDIFPEMADLSDALNVALLPIWGWGPTLGNGHLDPRRAAEALALLQPDLAVPIHWGSLHPLGMGWLNPRFLTTPPYEFVRHAAELAPHVKTEILPPGQTLSIVDVM